MERSTVVVCSSCSFSTYLHIRESKWWEEIAVFSLRRDPFCSRTKWWRYHRTICCCKLNRRASNSLAFGSENRNCKICIKYFCEIQRSTRPDPQSSEQRSLFSIEICFVLRNFKKWGRTCRRTDLQTPRVKIVMATDLLFYNI